MANLKYLVTEMLLIKRHTSCLELNGKPQVPGNGNASD